MRERAPRVQCERIGREPKGQFSDDERKIEPGADHKRAIEVQRRVMMVVRTGVSVPVRSVLVTVAGF